MLNINISSCSMMQKLPDYIIDKIILYNLHPIAEMFNNNLFYDEELGNRKALNIIHIYIIKNLTNLNIIL